MGWNIGASAPTRVVAAMAIAGGLAASIGVPTVARAALVADSSVCNGYSSYGSYIGSYCVRGDDPGQGTPVSIPGGSGVGSGAILGGSSSGALQDYGVFHGYATSAGTGVAGRGDGIGTNAVARGIMDDTWTLGGASGFGYLTLGWSISGSTALDGGPGEYANLYMQLRTVSGSQRSDNSLLIVQAGNYSIARIPFLFGQPFQFSILSMVTASAGILEGDGGPYAYYAAADFGHTSILSSIDAYDVDGRHIDGLTIAAASGARYPVVIDAPGDPVPPADPAPPGTVPEPASEALIVAGLFAAGWTQLRRARAPSGRRSAAATCIA